MVRRAAVLLASALALPLACGGGDAAPTQAPAWSKEATPSAAVGPRRGLTPVRSIVHLHSPFSHDACDGKPRGDSELGPIDQSCLNDLRAGLCAARIDLAALTDHDGSLADEDWSPALFLYRDGDELVTDGDKTIANWIHCDSGHRTLVRIGSENELMPVFMESHPEGDVGERHAIYDGTDVVAADALRAAGATLWVAHTESKDIDWLRELDVTGIEIYNIHAAIDPDIRRDHLGLDSAEGLEKALEFNAPGRMDDFAEPDLLGLPIMFDNEPAQRTYEALLGEGRRIAVTAGTDAHQNAFPIELVDGERGDSYRRMLRLASNFLLVADPTSPVAVEEALARGQSFVAFELLGTPAGFDVYAEDGAGELHELGAELPSADDVTLHVVTPTVANLYADAEAPSIETVLYRVDGDGKSEVARGTGELTASAAMPGAYYAVVTMTPRHLAPYLGPLPQYAAQSYTWVHSNAIYVRP